LLGRKVRQDIGYISGGIGPGGERNLFVAVTTDGHLPTQDIELYEPVACLLATGLGQRQGQEVTNYEETYGIQAISENGPL
jgi:hypothetical protein